jgi:hypothetical protein
MFNFVFLKICINGECVENETLKYGPNKDNQCKTNALVFNGKFIYFTHLIIKLKIYKIGINSTKTSRFDDITLLTNKTILINKKLDNRFSINGRANQVFSSFNLKILALFILFLLIDA